MIRQWFKGLEKREQYLLLAGAAAVVFYLLYGVMYRDMVEKRDRFVLQNAENRQTLAWMRENVQMINTLKRGGGNANLAGKSLAQLAEEAGKTAAVRIARFQPKDETEAQVWLEREDFNNVLVFLARLEIDYGLLLEDVAITSANAPGLVNLRLKFAK